jgi:hypothetical protein
VDEPQRPQDVLGEAIGETGESPGLPARPLPVAALEADLQVGLPGLAGGISLLELH